MKLVLEYQNHKYLNQEEKDKEEKKSEKWRAKLFIITNKETEEIELEFNPACNYKQLRNKLYEIYPNAHSIQFRYLNPLLVHIARKCKCDKKNCKVRKSNSHVLINNNNYIQVEYLGQFILNYDIIKVYIQENNDELWLLYRDIDGRKDLLNVSYNLAEMYKNISLLPSELEPLFIYHSGQEQTLKLYDVIDSGQKYLNQIKTYQARYRLQNIEIL